jgi:N-acetyltransferase
MEIYPVTLTGKFVCLEPLSLEHVAGLAATGIDDSIWKYMLYGRITNQADMRSWVQEILHRKKVAGDLPFAVIHLESGHVAGATRYLEVRPEHRSLEIGGTWYGVEFQRTVVNTESKFLLLRHAFECLGAVRVQFKTDLRNLRSQKAIERLGAIKEGVLRNHMITPEGIVRHSVYYSIIESEWPDIKARLIKLLKKRA